jgi:hypothetical protein
MRSQGVTAVPAMVRDLDGIASVLLADLARNAASRPSAPISGSERSPKRAMRHRTRQPAERVRRTGEVRAVHGLDEREVQAGLLRATTYAMGSAYRGGHGHRRWGGRCTGVTLRSPASSRRDSSRAAPCTSRASSASRSRRESAS